MGKFDMCEMYNSSFISNNGDEMKPLEVFCLFQIALIIIVNGFTLLVVGRTSASYDHVTQLFFKALSSTYVCLGASFVSHVACSEIVGMHLVAFKLNIAIKTSFLFLSLGFLACINVNRYIMIVRPLRYHSIVTIERARAVVAIIAILSLSLLICVPIPNTLFDNLAIAIENCDPVAIQEISLRLRPLNVLVSLLFIAFLTVTTYTNLRTLVIANRLNVRTRKQLRYLASVSADHAIVETETSASVSTAVPMVADMGSEAIAKGHHKELSKTSKICRATYLASASANHATVETETSPSVSTAVPMVADMGIEAITKGHNKELSKTSKICRATWTVSLITLSLYLAWVPQIGMMICQIIPIYPSKPWMFTSTILVHGNMWWTPAIYLGTDKKYRRTAKELFGKKKLRSSWSS